MPPLFATNRLDAFIFYAVLLIWCIPEILISFMKRTTSGAKTSDRASRALIFVCNWLGIYAGFQLAFSYPSFAIPWYRTALFFAGIFLMLAGMVFRRYSIHVLGRYFTTEVAIQPGQTVVDNGPYHWIRHPSYTGALMTIFGVGLAFTNWLSLIGVMVITFVGYGYRVWVEEKTLVNALGDPYRQYMERTKRFIPFVY